MKFVVPEYKGENKGHYSPGVISNGLLFVSGQLSIDPDTRKVPDGGIEEHTYLALDNLDRVLKEAGVSRSSVVQCRIYVSDIDDWDKVNVIYSEFFGEHKPARIVVPVSRLHFGCLIEIEAIAEVN